jgi:hypothetical protein
LILFCPTGQKFLRSAPTGRPTILQVETLGLYGEFEVILEELFDPKFQTLPKF